MPLTRTDVEAAAQRIAGRVKQTPLLEVPELGARAGGRVFLKLENQQVTGSFKIRGALNALLAMPEAVRQRGVVTYSSGNMGRAVAMLAQEMGFPCVIIVPQDIPATKLQALKDLGVELIINDGSRDRLAIAQELEQARGLTILAGGHADVIAGQGTVALEALEQLRAMGLEPDNFVVPCASGGLAAGCALTLSGSKAQLILVEPTAYDTTLRSLETGQMQYYEPGHHSICKALRAIHPAEAALQILQAYTPWHGVRVEDNEVEAALDFLTQDLKLTVEPSAATGLAGLLQEPELGRKKACPPEPWRRGVSVVVITGGNVG